MRKRLIRQAEQDRQLEYTFEMLMHNIKSIFEYVSNLTYLQGEGGSHHSALRSTRHLNDISRIVHDMPESHLERVRVYLCDQVVKFKLLSDTYPDNVFCALFYDKLVQYLNNRFGEDYFIRNDELDREMIRHISAN